MPAEKVTVSVIKADVGSVVGHSRPHPSMLEASKEILTDAQKQGIIEDFYVTRVGDDINLYMTHYKGEGNKDVHGAAWECFQKAAKIAKSMKLYAAGQDILTDAFSGNVKGAGPGSAEMSFEERGSEPLLFFMADKTEPSAYSLPLSRIFLDPFTTTGLVVDARAKKGFDVEIQDVIGHKRVTMSSPEETLSILSLLGDTSRYAIKRINSRSGIGPACVVSTDKLNLTAGKYIGKDDPVCICRAQSGLPSPRGLRPRLLRRTPKNLLPRIPAERGQAPGTRAHWRQGRRAHPRGLLRQRHMERGQEELHQGEQVHQEPGPVHALHPRTRGDGVHLQARGPEGAHREVRGP